MKIYYYLIFRIYNFYLKSDKDEKMAILTTALISWLIVVFTIFILYSLVTSNFADASINYMPNKKTYLIFVFLLFFLNYFLFVKNKKFLTFGFKEDTNGGYLIILFLFFIAGSFVFVANKNRERIMKKNEVSKIENL